MKLLSFALLASVTFGIKIQDYPAPSPLIVDPNWVDYPTANVVRVNEITNPKFEGAAATDFDLSKEPSCPRYMDNYNCASWTGAGASPSHKPQNRPFTENSGNQGN